MIISVLDLKKVLERLHLAGLKIKSEWNDDDGLCKLAIEMAEKYNIQISREDI